MIAISRLSKTYTHRRHQKASEGITITITTLHRPTRGGAHTQPLHIGCSARAVCTDHASCTAVFLLHRTCGSLIDPMTHHRHDEQKDDQQDDSARQGAMVRTWKPQGLGFRVGPLNSVSRAPAYSCKQLLDCSGEQASLRLIA